MNKYTANGGRKNAKRRNTQKRGGKKRGVLETAAVPFGLFAISHLMSRKKRSKARKTIKKQKINKKTKKRKV